MIARYDLRVKQWDDAKIIKTDSATPAEKTGFIDWDFNGTSNGPAIVRKQRRRFALYRSTPKGSSPSRFDEGARRREARQVARLVPITQDVDMMALLASNGSLLAPELRAKAYSYLANILGDTSTARPHRGWRMARSSSRPRPSNSPTRSPAASPS